MATNPSIKSETRASPILNLLYQIGTPLSKLKIDGGYKMDAKTVRIPAPLCGVRFIVLTDGTVFENEIYELNKRLTADEYTAILDHAMTLLCNNVPKGDGSMIKSFREAGI